MNLKKGLLVHFRKQKALFDPFVRQSVHMYAKKVTMFVWAVRQNPWNVHLIPPMGYREMGKSWAEVADAEVHWSHVHLGRHLPDLLFSDCFCKEKKEILKQVLDSVTWETSGDYIVGSHFTLLSVCYCSIQKESQGTAKNEDLRLMARNWTRAQCWEVGLLLLLRSRPP